MPSSCSQYHVVSWPFLHKKNQFFEPRQNMLCTCVTCCVTCHLYILAYLHLPVPLIMHSYRILSVYYINVETAYLVSGSWMRMSLSNISVSGILTVFCKSAIGLICYNHCFRNCYRREKGTLKNAMNKHKCFIMEDKTLLDMQQLMQTHHHNVFSSAEVTTPQ